MTAHSTVSLNQDDGSTAPHLGDKRLRDEAAAIEAAWRSAAGGSLASRLIDPNRLRRHRSLILNLVVEDCDRFVNENAGEPPLFELATRYQGLGESLERSIVRQLEVQDFLRRHPNVADIFGPKRWPQPGETFGDFEVIEELGRGALARVFLCRQQNLGQRLIVVKVSFGRKRLEGPLLARLQHPNIVPIYSAEFQRDVNAGLICMPYLGRSTFVDLVALAFRNGTPRTDAVIADAAELWLTDADRAYWQLPASPSQARSVSTYLDGVIELSQQVAEGLAFAHAKGIVHGDIKPSNVLLSHAAEPLLFDFNLGRDLAVVDGPAGGTLPYMAPEQMKFLAAGNLEQLPAPSIASDVYSFGALLCELVTGKPPYAPPPTRSPGCQRTAKDVLLQQRAGPPNILAANSYVNPSLASLMVDCLAFEPAVRPNMQQAASRLRQQQSLKVRSSRKLRYHRRAVLTGMFLAGILGLIVGAVLVARPPYPMRALNQAIAAIEAGDQTAGAILLDQAIAADPSLESARFLRIRCHLADGDLVGARQHLTRLQQQGSPAAKPWIGYYFDLAGQYAAAVLMYQDAVDVGFQSAAIFNNLGMSYLFAAESRYDAQTRLTRAAANLRKAMSLEPDSEVIRANSARAETELVLNGYKSAADLNQEEADWLRTRLPECGSAQLHAFQMYAGLVERSPELVQFAVQCLRRASELGQNLDIRRLREHAHYAALRKTEMFGEALDRLESSSKKRPSRQPSRLDPFLVPEIPPY